MKEDLICGVAILLYLVLLYLLTTAFIKRGKHVIKILDIKEGYVLYEYEEKPYIRSSVSLEDIVKKYILITDVKHK